MLLASDADNSNKSATKLVVSLPTVREAQLAVTSGDILQVSQVHDRHRETLGLTTKRDATGCDNVTIIVNRSDANKETI